MEMGLRSAKKPPAEAGGHQVAKQPMSLSIQGADFEFI